METVTRLDPETHLPIEVETDFPQLFLGYGLHYEVQSDEWKELFAQAEKKGNGPKVCINFANSLEGRAIVDSTNPEALQALVVALVQEVRELREGKTQVPAARKRAS